MSLRSLNELFYTVVERDHPAVMIHCSHSEWLPVSSRELYRQTVGVARALQSWGIQPGDRVAILSENRPEWAVADFAIMLAGAASVPIFTTLHADQIRHVLNDSGARVTFVSSHDQLRKLTALRDHCALEQIVLMDPGIAAGVTPMRQLMQAGPAERDAAFDRRARAVAPGSLATIIYTSGTTGAPKGAMLTQENLASNLLHSLDLYDFHPGQLSVSFLPLSHVTARHVDYAMLWHGVTIAYCPFAEELLRTLAQLQPHFFVAVPRVYEKIRNQAEVRAGSGLRRKLFAWALATGRRHRDEVARGLAPRSLAWRLADRLVFAKIRQALGGRVEIFISGGAPLGRDLIDWYLSVGVRILEGYGLTEASPVVALNNPRHYRPGTVGRALANVELRLAEDGEIILRGPSIFQGYWRRPEETRAVFAGEWLRTGDIGRLDADGFLTITDRKRDLLKTTAGKFIAPQPIEVRLRAHPLVAEALVLGDRRKFAAALIAPHFPALEDWASSRGLGGSRQHLVADARVLALYKEIVAGVNRELADFERIRKIMLVADEFSVTSGALTPTLKLKRQVIEARYQQQIDQLYGAELERGPAA
jgi:long-chain acyl-CoA synthetase